MASTVPAGSTATTGPVPAGRVYIVRSAGVVQAPAGTNFAYLTVSTGAKMSQHGPNAPYTNTIWDYRFPVLEGQTITMHSVGAALDWFVTVYDFTAD